PWFSPVNLAASFERRKPKPEPVVEIDWAIGPGDDGWEPDPPPRDIEEEVHAVIRLTLSMDMEADHGDQIRAIKAFLGTLVGVELACKGEVLEADLIGFMSEADIYNEGG
ncbi:MAG TPA: hypothetical protein VKA74_12455, partial [Myxococcota bacterium]|nr:hypothetical protein [Myxococcota bacterium]